MKYIAYCRKSTESEDRQVLSIDSQINEMIRLAERDNILIDKIFRESMSAKSPGRPVFKEMLDYIEQNGKCIIYVWKLDRLARNAKDGGELSWFMDRKLILEIRTFEKIYKNLADDKFMMSLDFGIAKKYVDDLSTNVKRGFKAKLEKGGWPNRVPFGWQNDRLNKTVFPDPIHAPYVIEMFNLYATGSYGLKDITKLLYEKGLRTKMGYKVNKSVIHRALNNHFHYGIMEKDGKFYKGNHTPIISKEIFDKVQDILNGKSKTRKQKHNFPLRGFMRCNKCNCMLTATLKKGHVYYYCTNGRKNCDQHKKYLRSEKIEKMILKIFDKFNFDEEMVEIMYLAGKEKLDFNKNCLESTKGNLKKQLMLTREKQSKLVDSYLSDSLPEDVYKTKLQTLSNEITETEVQLQNLESGRNKETDTLELTKKVFLSASRAKKEFQSKNDYSKRKVLENLLWNLFIENQNLADYKLKEPYQIMTKAPQNADFVTWRKERDSNPRRL